MMTTKNKMPDVVKINILNKFDKMKDFKLLDEKKNDNIINNIEIIDADKLNYIVSNFDEIKKHLRPSNRDCYYDPLTICKKLLLNSKNGETPVIYKQTNSVGRHFAIKSISLQSTPREIRHTIAMKYYNDIDIVNAHPIFLLHLCKKYKIECYNLEKYVINRDKILQTIHEDKDTAKVIVLSLLNGGTKAYKNLKKKCKFIINFKNELNSIREEICALDCFKEKFAKHKKKKKKEKKDFNIEGSFINILLCDIESTVLQCMYDFYKRNKYTALVFDGLMLLKSIFPDLISCEYYVFEMLGIEIKLKIKKMNEGLQIPNDIEKYEDVVYDFYRDYTKLINNPIEEDHLLQWAYNSIVICDGGGKEVFITKNASYDNLTEQNTTEFKIVKTQDIMKNLDINILVLNSSYDPVLAKKVNDGVISVDTLTEEQKISLIEFKKERKIKDFIDKYRIFRKIRNVNKISFIPHLKAKTPYKKIKALDCFNSFTGFPLDDGKNILNDNVFENSKLYNHLLNEIMNGDIGEFNHFLDHIADMIQCPETIRANAHVFKTAQGMGKGMMAFWVSKLIGASHYISFEDIKNYFSNFNVSSTGKLLKVIEEVVEKGDAFSKHDILKGHIAMTRERCEPKGIDAYVLDHVARYWFFTNNEDALYIPNDDRRYTLHRSNDRYANNKEYFTPMWEDIKNADYCKSCFNFFVNRKYDEKNVMQYYPTQYKNEQKMRNIGLGVKFLIESIQTNFKDFDEKEMEDFKITSTEIKCIYKDWCIDNGCKFSYTSLKTQWNKIGLGREKVFKINKKNKRGYVLKPDDVLEKLKNFLKDDKFSF